MPSVTIKNGKVQNPVASKILLSGKESVEIKLDQLTVVTAKQSFCVVTLGKHYFDNQEKYGNPEQFIDYLSKNFKQVNIDTQKGIMLGTEIHTRSLNKLKKYIQALIAVDWHTKHGKLKGL